VAHDFRNNRWVTDGVSWTRERALARTGAYQPDPAISGPLTEQVIALPMGALLGRSRERLSRSSVGGPISGHSHEYQRTSSGA
jgi:hypothetical protein